MGATALFLPLRLAGVWGFAPGIPAWAWKMLVGTAETLARARKMRSVAAAASAWARKSGFDATCAMVGLPHEDDMRYFKLFV